MYTPIIDLKPRWTRSNDGLVAGVCTGIARNLDVEAWIIQAILVISVLCCGIGLIPYIGLAICLPKEDETEVKKSMLLGTCYKVARKAQIEIGLIRFLFLMLAFGSLGLILILYVALYFLLPDPDYN